MQQHIGKILQEKLQEEGMPTVKDFAAMLGLSGRTIYNVFNGDSDLTLTQVVKASTILKHNLIADFMKGSDAGLAWTEPQEQYKVMSKEFHLTFNIYGNKAAYKKYPDLLDDVEDVARKHGFRLG